MATNGAHVKGESHCELLMHETRQEIYGMGPGPGLRSSGPGRETSAKFQKSSKLSPGDRMEKK